MKIIPHNEPSLGKEEIQAVTRVLSSQWIISGKETTKFETTMKQYVGRKYALAVSSGHAALHLSLLLLGVGQGDEVIIPAYTTPDLLNVIYYCKAIPVPVDVERNNFVIDAQQIEKKLSKKTKAMIIPHMFGLLADVKKIKRHGIPVIEDCAQAIGTVSNGKPVGHAGDISIFSFYASKLITTGQGGMLLTNNKKHYEIARDLIDYNNNPNYKVRYNYPMTDIAASIGNVQFPKITKIITRRKYIASRYGEVLMQKNIAFWPQDNEASNYFRFLIALPSSLALQRVQTAFAKQGITTIIPYKKYELPYRILGLDVKNFPNTTHIADKTLSLPIFQGLHDHEVGHIIKAMRMIL